MKRKIVTGSKVLLLIILLAGSSYLLGEDTVVFLKWWAALLVLGIGFLPLTGRFFPSFKDGGWLVSKVLGIAGSGFIIWFLVCCRLAVFTAPVCIAITTVLIFIIWLISPGINHIRKKNPSRPFFKGSLGTVLDDELVFTFFFLIWTYFAGFHPVAYGTEKFMDYGFMMAMMRSETLPAKDLWYTGGV